MTLKRKKLFTATTATTLVASALLVTPTFAATTFKDVPSTHSLFEEISLLASQGVITGYPDGTFKPGAALTRGQAAKIIANVLKLDVKNVTNPNFADVPPSHQYYGPIAALAQANIINGYDDQTFKVNETISRGQVAKIIALALKLEPKNNDALPFTDVSKEDTPFVKALLDHGITNATGTTFGANEAITRGQAAAFIVRALNVFANPTPQPQPEPQPEPVEKDFELTILHSNDTHARAENAPKRAAAVKELRAENPNSLLLDAGDVFSGTLYFNEFQGEADLKFMNYMGYDLMTFGNHEFDLGSSAEGHKALADFIKAAEFSFVSANVDFSGDDKFTGLFNDLTSSEPEKGKIYSGIVKEIDGEKVGIFGLTTAETADISSPGKVKFENYIEEANKAVKAFEDLGVDKIIALTHIGYDDTAAIDNDLELAKAVEGIDVIVGGHSHTKLDEPVVVDKNAKGEEKDATIIVQAYQYSDFLGTLDVAFDEKGVVVEYAGKLIELGKYTDDPGALEILKPYKEKVDAVQNEEIGATATESLANPRVTDEGNKDGLSVRKNETALGNYITDGMLAKAKNYTKKEVIMAFQNGGGIRSNIGQGPITVGEVISVLPFGNTLALMDVTGAELKAAFEVSVGKYPEENGGFLHVSKGTKIEFDSSKPAGSRVVNITYKDAGGNDVAIEDGKTYTVATNAFTAKGGDGYDMFAAAYANGKVTDLGLSDWENLRDHLKSLKEVKPATEGRIVDVAAQK
ncbi:5'-nucleotidase/2',3'-cyclic-nucleotide 2'-phosphodiesterase/3'-nucleotidase/5'-nucleotidase [Ureibacillus xyleni]|uniref:5'-nucleotidase/2',3'-cyclic-nucleotide 2'-phosphodiesterase/3'-nucleotidase/5'-nucleotidase n=1 Tax=Ureibacillus xyleni TaxID=614648 RepID=A0A285SEK2_9BACL|nr:5'-nucleotidase C-terminal domain-containing protein [Ureibacillus xyleni]SOC06317.1 5'-nucleotidase/2',3'-cyclic-nucleotide 2'-phosphodiesterase/3'-nucleotidase/5'-nucleotidase [Ureibacillus xyleni]